MFVCVRVRCKLTLQIKLFHLRMRFTCYSGDVDDQRIRLIITSRVSENCVDKLWTETVGKESGSVHAANQLEQWCVLNRIGLKSYLERNAVLEGIALLDAGISPYQGDVCHEVSILALALMSQNKFSAPATVVVALLQIPAHDRDCMLHAVFLCKYFCTPNDTS